VAKRFLSIVVMVLSFSTVISTTASSAATLFGPRNERLEVSQTKVKSGSVVEVSGKRFNTEVGIYVSLCKVPTPGSLPTPCGSIDMTKKSNTGYWISSNAPSYSKGLTLAYGKNGSFRVKLKVNQIINGYKCGKNDCAITVRADHLRTGDRSYDLLIPVRFSK
jgi:hypothetical protein